MKITDLKKDYQKDFNAMKLATNQNVNGIYNISKTYWLASRRVDSGAQAAGFVIRNITSSGDESYGDLWCVYSNNSSYANTYSYGIRPIITLKSNITTSDGDGSVYNPYKLVKK